MAATSSGVLMLAQVGHRLGEGFAFFDPTVCSPARRWNAGGRSKRKTGSRPTRTHPQAGLGGSPLMISGAVNAGEPASKPVAVRNPSPSLTNGRYRNHTTPANRIRSTRCWPVSHHDAQSPTDAPRQAPPPSSPPPATPRRGAAPPDSVMLLLDRAMRAVRHHQKRIPTRGFPHMQHSHDIGVPRQLPHCPLLTHKPRPIIGQPPR